jgi:hypothetical protein
VNGPPPDTVGERIEEVLDRLVNKLGAHSAPLVTPPRAASGTRTWAEPDHQTISGGIDMSDRPRPRARATGQPATPPPVQDFDEAASRKLLLDSIKGFGGQTQ